MADSLSEVGRTGLLMSGGIVLEEFLPRLRGTNGRRVFREMSDNDPVIGGIILALEKTLSRLDWHIEVPEDASPDDKAIQEFVQQCLEDMEEDWTSTLAEILSMIVYGWSYHEIVYKIRGGDVADPTHASNFNDGKIGWRKWPVRSQESLMRWETDPKTGEMVAMTQMVYGVGMLTVPMEKSLLFRTSLARNNPEGRSMIRNAYRPWYFKKIIEEYEAIGVERDLAGLPIAWLDPKYMSPSATPDERNLYLAVENIVQNIKRNQMEGVVFPLVYDEKGNKMIDLQLMSSGGTRQFDTDKIIGRYNQQIAMSVLADFLMLGHENVGTQSLGNSKIELWMMAVEAIAKQIAGVVNRQAIPRLLKLNGMDTENTPKIVFGSVENIDLIALGTFLKQMVDAGLIVPDATLEEYLRDIAKLTPIDEETRDDMGSNDQVPLGVSQLAEIMAGRQADKPVPSSTAGAALAGSATPATPATKPGTNPEANAEAPVKKPAPAPVVPGKKVPGATVKG